MPDDSDSTFWAQEAFLDGLVEQLWVTVEPPQIYEKLLQGLRDTINQEAFFDGVIEAWQATQDQAQFLTTLTDGLPHSLLDQDRFFGLMSERLRDNGYSNQTIESLMERFRTTSATNTRFLRELEEILRTADADRIDSIGKKQKIWFDDQIKRWHDKETQEQFSTALMDGLQRTIQDQERFFSLIRERLRDNGYSNRTIEPLVKRLRSAVPELFLEQFAESLHAADVQEGSIDERVKALRTTAQKTFFHELTEELHATGDEERFFDQLVERLRTTPITAYAKKKYEMELPGLFVTHKELGELRPAEQALPASLKPQSARCLAGFTDHVGDLPYQNVRSVLALQGKTEYGDLPITQDDTDLLVLSVSEAIKFYMPDEVLFEYIRFFMNNLQLRSNRDLLYEAIDNISWQFNFKGKAGEFPNARDTLETPEDFQDGIPRQTIIRDPELLSQAANEPEMLLTLAIFQAALASYVEQFKGAVERSEILSIPEYKRERKNALQVLTSRFQEFAEFVIFPTFGGLAAEEMHKIKMADGGETIPEAQYREAIHVAWRTFFRTGILSSEVKPSGKATGEAENGPGLGEDEEENKIHIRCPVFRSFGSAMQEEILEEIFEHVNSHHELAPFSARASRLAAITLADRYQGNEGRMRLVERFISRLERRGEPLPGDAAMTRLAEARGDPAVAVDPLTTRRIS